LTETTASVKIRRMELDKKQREVLGKTLLDIAKLILAINVLTPILSPRKNFIILTGGVILFTICLISGIFLSKEE